MSQISEPLEPRPTNREPELDLENLIRFVQNEKRERLLKLVLCDNPSDDEVHTPQFAPTDRKRSRSSSYEEIDLQETIFPQLTCSGEAAPRKTVSKRPRTDYSSI